MVDATLPVPVIEETTPGEQTLAAAIDRGIQDADEGRTVSLDEMREMIPKWISKFAART